MNILRVCAVSTILCLALSPISGTAESKKQLAILAQQDVPTRMVVGETKTLKLTFKNTGATAWTHSNLQLRPSAQSRTFWGAHDASITNQTNVAGGGKVTLTMKIKAPQETGHHPLAWQLTLDNKILFSHQETILVETADHRAEFVSQLFPSSVVPGENFKVLIQYRNIGQTTWDGAQQHYSLNTTANTNQRRWGVTKITLEDQKTVHPGGIATFSFTATAPMQSGLFNFQWEMRHNKLGAFGDLTPASNIQVGNLQNGNAPALSNAAFHSVLVEEEMIAGEEYDVAVIYKNTGESAWWAGNTRLVSQNPHENLVWFINRVDYGTNGSTQPGDIHAFRFAVRAPQEPGKYNFQWQIEDTLQQKLFGDKSDNITINVLPR